VIIDIPHNDRPLCPQQDFPTHPSHQLHVAIQNAAYGVIDRNEDNETIDANQEKVYEAISYNRFDGRMYLYRISNSIYTGKKYTHVEAFYYKCSICGFTLPATQVELQ
jgi:hypothetical protein